MLEQPLHYISGLLHTKCIAMLEQPLHYTTGLLHTTYIAMSESYTTLHTDYPAIPSVEKTHHDYAQGLSRAIIHKKGKVVERLEEVIS